MTLQSPTWEHRLLTLAYEGLHPVTPIPPPPTSDRSLLAAAYDHSRTITARHSRSFFLASALLSAAKRRAARALYAFCRITDDLVDSGAADAAARLSAWHSRVQTAHPRGDKLAALAWADTQARFNIPPRYADQLIEGVARDLRQTRYATFADLTTYAYGVASTVGLMSMHIIGFAGPQAVGYAVKLGVALQLTNILRDVAEDWQVGRLYLPQDELAQFGLSEQDVVAGVVDDRWRRFMQFQIGRTRRLYDEAWPGIGMLNADGRPAIAAAARFYRAILDDIEQHDYDVFSRRAHVTGRGKLAMLPSIWWQSKQF